MYQSVCTYERRACSLSPGDRGRTCLFAMLKLLCHSITCRSRAISSVPQLGLLHRVTKRMSTSDRSYPTEPRVGVGVVILRPGPPHTHNTEVSSVLCSSRVLRALRRLCNTDFVDQERQSTQQGPLVIPRWFTRAGQGCVTSLARVKSFQLKD